MVLRHFAVPMVLGLVSGCGGGGAGDAAVDSADEAAAPGLTMDLTSRALVNEAAYVPPQCYTKTIDDEGGVHNPCYACHIEATVPNYINDDDLQLGYSFPTYAETNRWSNLFVDRSSQLADIEDSDILAYVRDSNYFDPDGTITLARVLGDLPAGWDFDGDGEWSGFVPDCHFRFDEAGFDHAPDGTPTGWRAFGYYPFLGTFWPANGSTDDVLIRLDAPFRNDEQGRYDARIYKVNLAVVEAMIKREDVTIEPVDETVLGVDVDKNGIVGGTVERVTYDWAPLEGRFMSYVGEARLKQEAGEVHLAAGLFPEGTEFLHSVRYIDPADDGQGVRLAPRMKELRYARKQGWRTYTALQDQALNETKEKDAFPDRLREVFGNVEEGVSNNQGWVYQGFIEDAAGELRPQTYEESVFCVGCHGGIGATTDGVFAFPRRFGFETLQHGWYHWSRKGLDGIPEPLRSDGAYEYSFYLENNGAGDEFRANDEIIAAFFDEEGDLKPEAAKRLHSDISALLFPSRERALLLNKAYKTLVAAQGFIHGRDAMPSPPVNVHREVAEGQASGVEAPVPGR